MNYYRLSYKEVHSVKRSMLIMAVILLIACTVLIFTSENEPGTDFVSASEQTSNEYPFEIPEYNDKQPTYKGFDSEGNPLDSDFYVRYDDTVGTMRYIEPPEYVDEFFYVKPWD